jgi:hypothetical protein
MKHAPMNTAIAIASAALGALYIQVLTLIVILAVYQLGWGRSRSTTRSARWAC